MYRSLIVLLFVSTALADPFPKDKDPLYFPIKVGTKLVYETKTDGVTEEITETVTKVEAKDEVYRVTVFHKSGENEGGYSVMEVSRKEIFRIGNSDVQEKVPSPILKLPAKSGDTWTREIPFPNGKAMKIIFKVRKEEEVEVPVGKFNAIPVEIVTEMDGKPQTPPNTIWFAPEVGWVKSTSKFGKFESSQVLKSFTEGK